MSPPMFRSKPFQDGGGNGDLRSVKYPVALFLVVFAVVVTTFTVSDSSDDVDASVTIDNLEYVLNSQFGAFVAGYELPPVDLEIPSSVTYDNVKYPVT